MGSDALIRFSHGGFGVFKVVGIPKIKWTLGLYFMINNQK